MRFPRVRFTVRKMMILSAIAAIALLPILADRTRSAESRQEARRIAWSDIGKRVAGNPVSVHLFA
jgi:hypothetical protein